MRIRARACALAIVCGTNAAPLMAERASSVAAPPPRGTAVAPYLRPALELASEHLRGVACRALFEELDDFTGRPVARRLEEAGRSPSAHLARLRFVESAGGPCARDASIAAWSVAGDGLVRVCPGRFVRVALRDAREAAAILIHELLHTLGVTLDAAAHGSLTAAVRRRCGL